MLSRLSIRQKLTVMLMVISCGVLLLAAAAFVTWDFNRYRADMESDLRTQAQLILENTKTAVEFLDPVTAGEILEMLEIAPHTQLACLYSPEGALFAYRVFREPVEACPATPGTGLRMAPNRMFITERLPRDKAPAAALMIGVDLGGHRARIRTQATAVAAIVLAGLLISLLLSSALQRIVGEPIAELASTARSIADRGDYSIRATRTTRDEIGVLVRAFNQMLDEIQESQRERSALLDRELEANRLKDEFLATLSHELRTPLNAIVGWVHLLRRGQLPEDERTRALERIDRNAHAQARLVQDLLDVSRITSGKLLLDVRNIDLSIVVDNALDACQAAADARRVSLVKEFSGAFPTMGDPDRLQQVLWNLITNAVRFTPADGRVSVSISRADTVDTVEVRDTGAGIEPQFIPFMFEPFRQADGASTRAHGGLGLGLTIVRRLTEMHGGRVAVASEGAGQGATLTVTLPVRRPATVTVAPQKLRPRVASLSDATVLLVEDDPDTLELLESTLRMAGARPVVAHSVAAAIRAVDGIAFDAVVSDIAMPGQNGYTLMTLLKDQLGAGMPAVTIALTAYASRVDRERALAAGFSEHLAKPVNPDILLQTLAELLAANAAQP